MSKAWKIFIGIVAVIILIILIYDQIRINNLIKDNQIKDVQLMMANDTVKAYKTKNGESYYKLNSVQINNAALKESLDAMGIDLKKYKEKEVNWKQIVSVLREQLEVAGNTGPIPLEPIPKLVNDTSIIKAKGFGWSNTFLTLNGIAEENRIRNIAYAYQTGILHTTEKIKNKSLVTISLTDKVNAKITEGSQFLVEPTKSWYDHWWIYGLAGLGAGIWLAK